MAGAHNHKAATQFTCIDRSVEPVQSSRGNTDGYVSILHS